jgi:hypothetical protein
MTLAITVRVGGITMDPAMFVSRNITSAPMLLPTCNQADEIAFGEGHVQ